MIDLAGSWQAAAERCGLPAREIPELSHMAEDFSELEHLISTGQISLAEYSHRATNLFNGCYSAEEIADMYSAIIKEEFPGIAEVIGNIKKRGFATACLSNTCAAHWLRLDDPQYYPAIGMLDFRHASHLFQLAKPDPQIYRRFEQETAFHANAILFFDDRLENIAAAEKCGWQTVHINDTCGSVEQIQLALRTFGILS